MPSIRFSFCGPSSGRWARLLGCAGALLGWGQVAPARPAGFLAGGAGSATEAGVRYRLERSVSLAQVLFLPRADRQRVFAWAGSAGMRFAGRVSCFWYTPESAAQEQAYFDSTRRAVAELHALNPDIVVQGTVFEVVYAHVGNLPVPNRLRAEFGEDTVAVPYRNFRLAKMVYPGYFSPVDSAHYRWDARPPGQAPGTPDMSRPEAQLWFYYRARRQIDAGCEALHFGQVMMMDHRDPGHHAWWALLQRVRAYARTRNRGFVLCDAHTQGEYYDPDPAHPVASDRRQLLFDFHSHPLRPVENDTVRNGPHGAHLAASAGAIYGQSKGGLAPGQWPCRHLPALAEFDNCGTAPVPGRPGQWPWIWGLDEISWFATRPAAYRSQWLIYAAARVRQLDPDAYLQMPGVRGVEAPPQPWSLYRADLGGQGDTIRAIWASETTARARQLLLMEEKPQP